MSSRKVVLRRLRTALGDADSHHRWWSPRALLLTALMVGVAVSVGWWVYSHTTDQDVYQRAERHWRAGRYPEAVMLYERLAARSSQPTLAENALFDAATISYYHLHNIDQAVDLYKRLISDYPNGEHIQEACMRLGQIYESDWRDERRAVEMWEESIKIRPEAPVVLTTEQYLGVLSKIADGYFKLNEFDRALTVYQRIADDYTGTHNADQANVKLGVILQMQRLYRLSLKPLQAAAASTRCVDCRFMAQTALIDAYEGLEDLASALKVVDALTPSPGQEDFPRMERTRLRRKQGRLASQIKVPPSRRGPRTARRRR